MQLTSRGITLRQVTEDDLPFLFELFVDPCRSHLWMCGRTVHDERSFHEAWIGWSTSMMGAKFLVEAAHRPIGLVFDYDRAIIDGFTKVTARAQRGKRRYWGAESSPPDCSSTGCSSTCRCGRFIWKCTATTGRSCECCARPGWSRRAC